MIKIIEFINFADLSRNGVFLRHQDSNVLHWFYCLVAWSRGKLSMGFHLESGADPVLCFVSGREKEKKVMMWIVWHKKANHLRNFLQAFGCQQPALAVGLHLRATEPCVHVHVHDVNSTYTLSPGPTNQNLFCTKIYCPKNYCPKIYSPKIYCPKIYHVECKDIGFSSPIPKPAKRQQALWISIAPKTS